MKPIGLTLKNIKINPYTGRTGGELMIVHQCLNCGRISSNRIAGDDNPHVITCLLENSTKLNHQSIPLLTQEDKPRVLTALYGYEYLRYSK